MKKLLLLAIAALPFMSSAQSPAYSFGKTSSNIEVLDTTAFTSTTIALTSSLGTVDGVLGADTDPCGDVYLVYKMLGNRNLGIVDLSTGVITDMGVFSDQVANIAFIPDGTLYAVTGNGATTSETLYTVDPATAVMTLATTLSVEDDGESIEFCPDNNLMYRWSGWSNIDCIMQSIDLTTFQTTNIAYSGTGATTINNVGASTYAGNGKFLCSDVFNDEYYWIDTAGVVSAGVSTASAVKGLVFEPAPPAASVENTVPGADSFCPGDSVTLICNSDAPGTYDWFLDGVSTGLTTQTVTVGVEGSYTCEVTTACGVLSTAPIILSELVAPNVNITPSPSVNFCPGQSITLTGANGGTRQWYLDGVIIPGANGTTYVATVEGSYNQMKTNMDGCSDTADVATMLIDTCSIGLDNLSSDFIAGIYPNPTSGNFTIDFNNPSEITGVKVLGLDGKVIKVILDGASDSESIQVDISDLRNGTYFVHFETTTTSKVYEIVKL